MNTKHDLDAQTAKLNLDEIEQAIQIGAAFARVACERGLSTIQNANTLSERMNAANRLSEAANAFKQIVTTQYYIRESRGREKIELIR